MKLFGYELAEDALDSHKCYIINGDELYWLMELEARLARTGEKNLCLRTVIKSALDNELEEEE